jgi:hypothetical protein
MPGRDPGGFAITAILGIVGGVVGRSIGWYGDGDPVGFVIDRIALPEPGGRSWPCVRIADLLRTLDRLSPTSPAYP